MTLRCWREKNGFSIQEVADYLGIQKSQLVIMETGRSLPGPRSLKKLLDKLMAECVVFYLNRHGGVVWELDFGGTNWRFPQEKRPLLLRQNDGRIKQNRKASSIDSQPSDRPS